MRRSFESIILTNSSLVLEEYSRMIRMGATHRRVAIDIIETNIESISIATLYELITITAISSSVSALEKISTISSHRLTCMHPQYISKYISECSCTLSTEKAVKKFSILWGVFTKDSSISPDAYVSILHRILNTIRSRVGYTRGCHLYISMTKIIIKSLDTAIREYVRIRIVLLKIACYDNPHGLFMDLASMGCSISTQSREEIIEEFTYTRRSLEEIIEIVDYLFDNSVDPRELYPFYKWAVMTNSQIDPILQYLIDVGVRISIHPVSFFKLVYGTTARYYSRDIIITSLRDMFDVDVPDSP